MSSSPALADEAVVPINVICNRVRDVTCPGAPSFVASCQHCLARVWLAAETVKAVLRLGRQDDARVICVPCSREAVPATIAMLTYSGQDQAVVAEWASRAGVAPGTPVINIDGGHRA